MIKFVKAWQHFYIIFMLSYMLSFITYLNYLIYDSMTVKTAYFQILLVDTWL